jgi:hypothetical protein
MWHPLHLHIRGNSGPITEKNQLHMVETAAATKVASTCGISRCGSKQLTTGLC